MEETIREFSGRKFTAEDLSIIKETVKQYPKLSQKELACTICEFWGWQTINGEAKRVQCMDFLRELEREGFINLPAPRIRTKTQAKTVPQSANTHSKAEITKCGEIELEIARPGKSIARWREYVSSYHKLGDPKVFGCQLRYIITSKGQDLGCLLFSASSWALMPREQWIGWTSEEKKKRLHLIVNNSRFLILPWVRIPNLASRALSMAARRIQRDWLEAYCYAPVLLETFVEPPYKGTCYKASNWIYLGETQGRGRNDRYTEKQLSKKALYVLPLQRDCHAVLKGDKPYKVVDLNAI